MPFEPMKSCENPILTHVGAGKNGVPHPSHVLCGQGGIPPTSTPQTSLTR